MLSNIYPLVFKLALHRKDLASALAAAAETGLQLLVSEKVAAIEEALMAAGHGEEGVSALARWFAG